MISQTEGRAQRPSISALLLVAFSVGTDFTGVMLLVPAIEEAFSVDITSTQWVLNIYALVFAMFMVAGGKLGDVFGRRRLMTVGLAIFVLGSLGCALSPSLGALLASRAVQGVGAAMLWPNMLGTGATLASDDRRGAVMGTILACVNIGNVSGPLMGGVIVTWASWPLFFAINVILGSLSLYLCRRHLPADGPQKTLERVDLEGIAALGLAVLALLFALDVGAEWGWGSPALIGLLALSIACFALFPWVETRAKDPMIPAHWLRRREFGLLVGMNGLVVPAIFAALLYFPQYMTKVLGFREIWVSIGVMPMMAVLAVASYSSGQFYKALGPKGCLSIGYSLTILGVIAVIAVQPSWGYAGLLPAMVLLSLGGGFVAGPAGTATVEAVPHDDASLAGGLAFAVHLVVGAVGLAGTTAILNAGSLSRLGAALEAAGISLSHEQVAALNASAPGGEKVQSALAHLDAAKIETAHTIIRESFAAGMGTAFWLPLISAVLGLLCVLAVNESSIRDALSDKPVDDAG